MRSRWLAVALVAATVALQARVVSSGADTLPPADRPWLLAVGDSITYGWSVDPHYDGTQHSWALQVRDRLSQASGQPWALYSLACPGETTTSYEDGGCSGRVFVPGLDGRSQRQAVTEAVRDRGASLGLIVVELGTNDYFAARRHGGDVDAQLDAAAQRVGAVVAELQRLAPGVPVVVADIYDPHGTADSWAQAVHLDRGITLAARAHGAALADFLHAVNQPGRPQSDRCRLLDCAHNDIHPTLAGQEALAQSVLDALPHRLLQPSSFSVPTAA